MNNNEEFKAVKEMDDSLLDNVTGGAVVNPKDNDRNYILAAAKRLDDDDLAQAAGGVSEWQDQTKMWGGVGPDQYDPSGLVADSPVFPGENINPYEPNGSGSQRWN